MAKRLTGANTLAYLGVNAVTPSNFYSYNRNPTTHDYLNFDIGSFWLNAQTLDIFVLTNKDAQVATWSNFGGGSGTVTLTANDATVATASADNINVFGDNVNITTHASGSTLTITLDLNLSVDTITTTGDVGVGGALSAVGNISSDAALLAGTFITAGTTITAGTGLAVNSFTTPGVIQNDGSGNFFSTAGNDGELLIGSSIGAPSWQTITAGSGISIVNGHNSITISAGSSAALLFTEDTGTATPSGNNINFVGGTNISTTGSGSTVTIALKATVPVSLGGTGDTTLTSHGVLYGNGTSPIGVTAAGVTGQVLIGNTGSAPSWASAPVGVIWHDITGSSSPMVSNNGYVADDSGSLVTLTLPVSPVFGDILEVVGTGSSMGWKIAQNASQYIQFGSSATTIGVTGSLQSTNVNDALRMVCTFVSGGSSVWNVLSSIGNITVV